MISIPWLVQGSAGGTLQSVDVSICSLCSCALHLVVGRNTHPVALLKNVEPGVAELSTLVEDIVGCTASASIVVSLSKLLSEQPHSTMRTVLQQRARGAWYHDMITLSGSQWQLQPGQFVHCTISTGHTVCGRPAVVSAAIRVNGCCWVAGDACM